MANWAKIDENNIVEYVIITENDDDEGATFISGLEGRWVKTSYNTHRGIHRIGGVPFRKNFAEVGGYYDEERDAFIPPKREGEENFILHEEQCSWIPAPFPEDADAIIQYGNMFGEFPLGSKVYSWDPVMAMWLQAPTSEKPEGKFVWNPISLEWVEAFINPNAEEGKFYGYNWLTEEWYEVELPFIPSELELTEPTEPTE